MKKTSKIVSVIVAVVMCLTAVVALAACNKWDCDKSGHKWTLTEDGDIVCSECKREQPSYTDEQYREIYDANLSEFYTAYAKAKEATSVSERFALMAVAEAKLLEANMFSFTNANGGNYAISRVAPHTVTDTLWGSDQDRNHQLLVSKTLIKAEDRKTLIAGWEKFKANQHPDGTTATPAGGFTGADYNAWAKAQLISLGYELKDVYNMAYGSEITNWDILSASEQVDSEVLVNTYDGLMEYDELGLLQPALAESYTVSEDGKTYTFTLRSNLVWTDSAGTKVADLTAEDFVSGLRHALDAQGGLEYLVDGVIKGAHEYMAGTEKDFSKVGVKAEGNKVIYTLEEETSYFMTMLGYSIFAPLCTSYFTSHGGAFGVEEFAAAAATDSYTYAKGYDSIAYCGPYVITAFTDKNAMTLSANASYWNKDGINIKTINRKYDSGEVVTSTYDNAKSGVIDGAGLNTTTLASAKTDKIGTDEKSIFETYAYVSGVDATSFMVAYNVARTGYANWNDGALASTQTNEQMERTHKAMANKSFRQAMTFAFDRVTYRTARVGADTAATSLVNSYTPGNFVSLPEAVTIKINGTDTTFAAGTMYGAMIQAQLDADNAGATVWKEVNGEWKSNGFDGWYNADLAKEKLTAAIAELKAQGVEVSKENPIVIDVINGKFNDGFNAQGQAYKKNIEEVLEGCVVINLIDAANQSQLTYATYRVGMGYQVNGDVMTGWTGWGPDFGDPCTFLDTFLPDGEGYMTKLCGLW